MFNLILAFIGFYVGYSIISSKEKKGEEVSLLSIFKKIMFWIFGLILLAATVISVFLLVKLGIFTKIVRGY